LILSIKENILDFHFSDEYVKEEENDITVYVNGFFYIRGCVSGKDSIMKLISLYRENGSIPFRELFGSYIIIFKDKSRDEILIFTDNSNMRSFFYNDEYISDDIFQIIEKNKTNFFNHNAVLEYLKYGNIFEHATLVENIKATKSTLFYRIAKNTINEINKKIGDISEKSIYTDIYQYFDDLTLALSNKKITLDLTGGYDSRMIFCALKNRFKDMHIFISGPDSAKDVIVAKKVAEKNDIKIDCLNNNYKEISEKDLLNAFEFSYGQLVFDFCFRLIDFSFYRKNKGYDLRITGDGGVLHKDWWWFQDFPLYKKSGTNLKKFYYQRVNYSKINSNVFNDTFLKKVIDYDDIFTSNLAKYIRKTNTQTYDFLYYYLFGSKLSRNYNVYSKLIISYAPLWENEIVKLSYSLPRVERFYYNYIRRVTSHYDKNTSRLKTVYNMTASSDIKYKLLDIGGFISDYIKKAFRMIKRKIFNKNVKSDVDIYNIQKSVKDTKIFRESLEFMKNAGVLRNDVEEKEIDNMLGERMLNIYLYYLKSDQKILFKK